MSEAPNITCLISISDQVFFSIVTASLEAYKIKHSNITAIDHEPVETYGNLWGYITKKKSDNLSVLRVVFADVDTSADRSNDYAKPKMEAFELKNRFVNNFLPELEYIGDFHSHPYTNNAKNQDEKIKTTLELERYTLYNFSKDDKGYFKHLQKNEGRNFKLALAVTVYEMNPKVKRPDGYVGNDKSCIRFMYDNISIWIKAYAYIKSDGSRLPSKHVAILCPTIGFNLVGIINV